MQWLQNLDADLFRLINQRLSHPFLDGIMHPDVRPFMPWTDYNPFLGLIGLAPLHLACIASAVLGAAGVALWKRRSKGRST